jgi:hypothetical protein
VAGRGAGGGTDAGLQRAHRAQARCEAMLQALADENNPITLSDAEKNPAFEDKTGVSPMGLHPTEPRVWMDIKL